MNHTPIALIQPIPETGIDAIIRFGENYGGKITWNKPVLVVLVPTAEANLDNEPGIAARNYGWGYAGFDANTNIYWRYKNGPYEHCMQVLKVI